MILELQQSWLVDDHFFVDLAEDFGNEPSEDPDYLHIVVRKHNFTDLEALAFEVLVELLKVDGRVLVLFGLLLH